MAIKRKLKAKKSPATKKKAKKVKKTTAPTKAKKTKKKALADTKLKIVAKKSRTTPWKVAGNPEKIALMKRDFKAKVNRQVMAKKYKCSIQTIYYIVRHSVFAKRVKAAAA